MSAGKTDVRARTVVAAMRYQSGPDRVMGVFKAQLIATMGGTRADLDFLVEAAEILPDVGHAARFLKTIGMMRARAKGSPEVLELLARAEERTRSAFTEEELAEADLALDVIES